MNIFPSLVILVVMVAAVSSSSTECRQQNSLVAKPSVKLHVTFKRKSLAVHGQTEFDVFANPVVSDGGNNVIYDAFATFIEDSQELTYTFVNGSFFVADTNADNDGVKDREPTVRCLPSAMPFDAILPALNDVTPIPSASIGGEAVNCSSGGLYKTTFSGSKFALCVSGASGFTAYSSDMTIEVTYLSTPISISEPELSDDGASCAKSAGPLAVTATALALMTGDEVPESTSRKLRSQEHLAMEASSCECQSTPRPCIVFHGIGGKVEQMELQDEPSKRTGSINDHAPCCTTVKYAHLNTINHSWVDDSLQDKFCNFALSMSETSDQESGVIDDTIVVTHSLGGLTMATALATGKCRFGPGTSWIATGTPLTGSMAADYMAETCEAGHGELLKDLVEWYGVCPLAPARRDLVYQGGSHASDELNAKYAAAQEAYAGNVTAAMCSNHYVGVVSRYQLAFTLAANLFPHKSKKNDGFVEFQSCTKGLDQSLFGDSYTDKFYMPRVNHADTAFLTHDGFFRDSQKPFKWFECLL